MTWKDDFEDRRWSEGIEKGWDIGCTGRMILRIEIGMKGWRRARM
jgi:hypothetical protein